MNAFRLRPDMPLDRQYLRVCAVYRLMRKGIIRSKSRAADLIEQRNRYKNEVDGRAVVEVWIGGPFRNMDFEP